MRADAEAIARLARTLDQNRSIIDSLCIDVKIYRSFPCNEPGSAQYIATIEDLWRAFADGVIRAAGGNGTPESILAMDEKARDAAQKAYREAYEASVKGAQP